jgi:hypothetical protein
MKKITQLLTVFALGSIVILSSCNKGGDGPKNKEDEADKVGAILATIAGSPSSVSLDGESRSEWSGTTFTVTYDSEINGGTIAIADAPSQEGADVVWGDGGSYTLSDDGKTATYKGTPITIDGKTLTFDVEEEGGRSAVFYGTWKFSFQ